MLRVIPSASAAQAKSYYRRSDYYVADQERPGVWRGKGAERLHLGHGEVTQRDFDALCDNLDPATGTRLTARTDAKRTVGYDFNFHAPKSFSLLQAFSDDDRLLAAFQDSVEETMQLIEADMQTRVRGRGRESNRTTGEMTYARFDHFTSRPVDGVPDPHLHSHCFVFNATYDPVEKRWKAGQFQNLKRDAPYYQAAFHASLTRKLEGLGVQVVRTAEGWEVAGFERETIEKFSRRTRQIEALAAEKGIVDGDAKDALGAMTREAKAQTLALAELRHLWRDRLDPAERALVEPAALPTTTETATLIPEATQEPTAVEVADPKTLRRDDKAESPVVDGVRELPQLAPFEAVASSKEATPTLCPVRLRTVSEKAKASLDFAGRHLFERQAVVSERKLLATMLKAGYGQITLADAQAAVAESNLIVRNVNGQRMVTSRGVLDEENRLIDFARSGRGRCAALRPGEYTFRPDNLNTLQQAAARQLFASRDRVMILRGAAGAGKTRLMRETIEAIEDSGHRVFTFAPSAAASRGVLRDEGFATADTVARLLVDEDMQASARGQVLWIDEAGLIGSRQMAKVFDLAERLDCRVVLSGDRRQHGSVERGSVLRLLETEAGLKVAELNEIQRQKGAYRAAVKHLADGKTKDGFDALDQLGWVQEIADGKRNERLAHDYVAALATGQTAVVVSPTHAEGDEVTSVIRDTLREAGQLKGKDRAVTVFQCVNLTEAERGRAGSYHTGDMLQFHQNVKGGIRTGDRVTVADGVSLPLDQAARFQAFRPTTLSVAAGDRIRITHGGKSKDGHKLDNGALFTVAGFSRSGDIKLANGWTLDKSFGHFTHGYVTTSHAAQGKTVDRVFVAQSSRSWGATSAEQFYVSASRGRYQATIYTDDKEALREAVTRQYTRWTAMELVAHDRRWTQIRDRLRRALPHGPRTSARHRDAVREVNRD